MAKGRKKYIPTPALMWGHFENYRKWVVANPIMVHDFVGKDGNSVHREKQRPLTMEGFENFLYENNILKDASDYFENNEGDYADFISVCRRIKKIIREDQISGGLVGIYNHSITARLNNLVEKTENKNDVSIITVKRERRSNT